MNHTDFEKLCKEVAVKYANKHLDKPITEADVTYNRMRTTGNGERMSASVALPDGIRYVITYNGDKKELRVSGIKRLDNALFEIPDGDINNIELP